MKSTFKFLATKLAVAAVMSSTALSASAAFTITLNFTGLDATQQSYFVAAKTFWESAITGYAAGISLTGFTINATGAAIDGVGGILGSAGPSTSVTQGGFRLTSSGAMTFDTADINALIAGGSFTDVIKHEMGHVIGIGTQWTANGVYVNNSGQYTGAQGLATYKVEFNQPTATFIPVELGGGSGTANGHWNEVDGGAGLTGIVDGQGRDMRNELMTGWLNAPTFTSQMTVASLRDIGFTVNLSAVPEPGTWALLLAGVPLLVGAAKRRKNVAA